eukprot:scaffold276_cov32-Attheya_sp.AAC.1
MNIVTIRRDKTKEIKRIKQHRTIQATLSACSVLYRPALDNAYNEQQWSTVDEARSMQLASPLAS